MIRWTKTEYILKGLFLGLLVFVSIQNLDWQQIGQVALYLSAGLAAALIIALVMQARNAGGLLRNPVGFFLFVVLENPVLIYVGVLAGFAVGALQVGKFADSTETTSAAEAVIGYCALGGAILGYALGELRLATRGLYRWAIAIGVCAAVCGGLWYWFTEMQFITDPNRSIMLGVVLLLGLPFFYLLVFCGHAEESEVEIAAISAVLGLGIYLTGFPSERFQAFGLLVPVGLYTVYSIRILRPLRVFKHTLRGYGHNEVGKLRDALASFNRALELDPKNQLARTGMLRLHKGIDLTKLDAETKSYLNPSMCIGEAARMILSSATPSESVLAEASKILNFVAEQWPQMRANTDYYLVISETHEGKLGAASERLTQLLDPSKWSPDDRFRRSILFDAWQLALRTHPTLRANVGDPQLSEPGRRIEALGAIERQLRITPGDDVVLDFRREIFASLTPEEYEHAAASGPPADFPYGFAETCGNELLADPELWTRGAVLLKIAAHGQLERAPSILNAVAETAEKNRSAKRAKEYRTLVRDYAQAVGIENLAADQSAIYFGVVKRLADDAAAEQHWKAAIYNYYLLTKSETSGKETLRTLAQMYENDGQVFAALRTLEDALTRGADSDLLARKDRYYYSIEPEALAAKVGEVRGHFDVAYCVAKAKSLLDSNNPELEVLDWANHLSTLSIIMEPKSLVANVQRARCHLRRGERDDGLRLLEDVHEMKPSGNEERDAWEWSLRQLAALYLDEYHRPELAITCLKQFLESEKSGARTLFDLGRAYEASNDVPRAIAYYSQAAAFEDNPIRWDAEDALRRLRSSDATG